MEAKKYIKVTPAGTNRSFIIPAANEDFYRSQRAKVTKPTDEELIKEGLLARKVENKQDKEVKSLRDALTRLEHETSTQIVELESVNESLREEVSRLNTVIKDKDAEIARLQAECDAAKAELANGSAESKTAAPARNTRSKK